MMLREYLIFIILSCSLVFFSCDKEHDITKSNEVPTGKQYDIPWPSLADSPWPKYQADPQNTGRSRFLGPRQGILSWTFDSASIECGISINADSLIIICSELPKPTIYCLHSDGSVRWSSRTPFQFFQRATPLFDNQGIAYIATFFGNILAVDRNGIILWNKKFDASFMSVTMDKEGVLYAQAWNKILAFNRDGTILWEYSDDRIGYYPTSSLAISPDGKILYLPGINVTLIAFSIETKFIKWTYGNCTTEISPMVDYQGNIYLMGKIDSSSTDGFYSIKPDGTLRWKYGLPTRQFSTYYEGEPTIDYDGNIYFGFGDTLYSITWNGALRWKNKINGRFDTALICDGEGTVFITTYTPTTVALNETMAITRNGNIIWSYKYSTFMSPGSGPAITFNRGMIVPTEEAGRIWAFK